MKGRAHVLDSTPLHDAVATQDTVTKLRAAIRKLLIALEGAASGLAEVVRSALDRNYVYYTIGKPSCDWTTRTPARPSSMPWCATPTPRSVLSTERPFQQVPALRPSCWPSSPVKTQRRATTGSFASYTK